MSVHVTVGRKCMDCHEPHGTTNEHNLRVTARNNALCMQAGCHTATFPTPADIAAHTHHATGLQGGPRCVDCHMPSVQKSAVNYDIHSHAFIPLTPQLTLTYQMSNSCAIRCHRGPVLYNGTLYRDTNIDRWGDQSDYVIAQWLIRKWQTAVRVIWRLYQ